MTTATELKLNLGCRTRSMEGWTNFDCGDHPGVDVVGDIRNLSMFADGSVSEIYCSHAAEHVPHPEAPAMLKEWHRVLAPGGKLYIAVPDFERCVELYQLTGINQWLQDYVSGGQEYATAYHYAIYDEAKLTAMLTEAGFSDSVRVEEFPIGDPEDCSNLKSNIDGLSVSLNMVATK